MRKLLTIIFAIIILMVGSMAFVHAKPRCSATYQCKHIGVSKVKSFKARKTIKRAMQNLYSQFKS